MAKPEPKKLPAIYYDAGTGGSTYWFTMPDGAIVRLGLADLQRWMMHHEVDTTAPRGELSPFDKIILHAQRTQRVDYAGPLAGHRKGLFVTSGGQQVLVTRESTAYEAPQKLGKWPFWMAFLKALLKDKEQLDAVLDWWACGLRRLMKGEFGPGQALVLTGPPGCGKSLLQHLTTEIFGGRKADPFRYMTGATAFNGDLAEAEHLMIEDKSSSTDIRSRREFGARLKELVVNRDISIHRKGSQAITLHTFRRVTVTINDEVENLNILPPLDASILDKLTLLKCHDATGALKKTEPETWKAFVAELPAVRAFLMRREIPKDRACPRMGVKAFHNAEILAAASTLEPQNRLLALIDQVIPRDELHPAGIFTAEELEMRLRKSPFGFAVERLLSFSSACGVYLGRIANEKPHRVEKRVRNGQTRWYIRPAEE